MAKFDGKTLAIIALAVLAILILAKPSKSSYRLFTSQGGAMTGGGLSYINSGDDTETDTLGQFDGRTGVSTSLLPKEIPSQEDFGKFSPDAIMKGQNYLDPRSQIGYPGTVGGVLRNANYDVRSEPPNPRIPVSIFNNTTIVPDLMRPQFNIGR
jgi:hypothetical protein